MEMKTINSTTHSDEELIINYKNGDKNSMAELYKRYYKKVYAKCYSFTNNDDEAFDLTQDILLKAFDKIDMFKGESRFSTWLYSISQNHCIEYKRKANNIMIDNLFNATNLIAEDDDYFGKETMENENRKKLLSLEAISEPDKEILLLKYKYNLSIKELQEKYNLTESAVKMRLLRAKDKAEKIFYLSTKIPVAN